jgi:signal transduction histidine kinase
MADLMGAGGGEGRDEIGRLEASVVELLQKGQETTEAQRQQLAEREGLAQVGELAAEMAHEFKRPLATVRTALSLLEQEYVLDERGQRMLGGVNEQLEHLAETMRDLFSLAKPVGLEVEEMGLTEVLDEALLAVTGHPAQQGVTVVRDYGAGNVRLWADRKRLEQAITNLVLNGLEAMPGGGQLTVRTTVLGPDRVEIEVRDTGVGIPAAELERIILPFYSTKPSGTGLGLPLVTRVVAAHEGTLALESEPGKGTTVRVRLRTGRQPGRLMEAATWQTRESSS